MDFPNNNVPTKIKHVHHMTIVPVTKFFPIDKKSGLMNVGIDLFAY